MLYKRELEELARLRVQYEHGIAVIDTLALELQRRQEREERRPMPKSAAPVPALTFGQRLRTTREQLGLSRPQLSRATLIPTWVIYSHEHLKYGPREQQSETLAAYSRALGVSMKYLTTGDANEHAAE